MTCGADAAMSPGCLDVSIKPFAEGDRNLYSTAKILKHIKSQTQIGRVTSCFVSNECLGKFRRAMPRQWLSPLDRMSSCSHGETPA